MAKRWGLAARLGIGALTLIFLMVSGRAGYAAPARHAPIKVLRDRGGKALHLSNATGVLSYNWSGYVLPNFETGQTYTAATATWVVPAVTFDFEDSFLNVDYEFSSSWVGIGGYCEDADCFTGDTSLIQLGTEQDAYDVNGILTTAYYAWYEKLPAASKLIKKFVVNPGDTITASLSCIKHCDKKQQTWQLTMTDATNGSNWTKKLKYKASELSADWIEEAPYGFEFKKQKHPGYLPMADYGTASFSSATANNAQANLGTGDSVYLTGDPLTATTYTGDESNPGESFNNIWGQTSVVSSPNSTLDGFNACWGSFGVLTQPCNPD